jgi:hypothetical protein
VLSFCHLLLAIEATDANAGTMAGAYSRLSEVIAGYGGSKGNAQARKCRTRDAIKSTSPSAFEIFGSPLRAGSRTVSFIAVDSFDDIDRGLAGCLLKCLCKFDLNEKTERLCSIRQRSFFNSIWQEVATFRPWGFPCCVRFPCVHAAANTPV